MMKSFGTSPRKCFSSSNSDDSFESTITNKESVESGTRKKGSSFASRIHEHVKIGSKLSETLKGKLNLGKKIIQKGGRGNIFKHIFGMQEDEKLLKASQCYLYTTAGPIAGVLFVSTKKVAFCSENHITFSSSSGELVSAPYKVLIPVQKIREVNESQNVNKLKQKYIEIVTEDEYEFWFMGFLSWNLITESQVLGAIRISENAESSAQSGAVTNRRTEREVIIFAVLLNLEPVDNGVDARVSGNAVGAYEPHAAQHLEKPPHG
ncbi:hypothetical protein Ahy_A05g023618 isoform A [Arachis hypogaea]|uniref:GRAM domain-containing protein n=1 Tax=Arachis hypogaea TaxID=3818 RepID=A0A445D422_ARAHY|nr:hypothetical protein Ahy_A05g023618 isoform A [Arachis hypogaea]